MNLAGALDHLEKMLYAQLRDAVGKELTPQDFESYMVSHERKLFKPCYRPAPLTYAVRRSATAFPDGSLSLEDSERAPVAALSRRVDVPGDEPRAVRLPLGASTIVECQGETYAHAYTARTFAGARPAPLQLVASATAGSEAPASKAQAVYSLSEPQRASLVRLRRPARISEGI